MEAIYEVITTISGFLKSLNINPMYVLLWVAAGYIQKTYLSNVTKFNEVWKTFILGSVFSVIYAILLRNVTDKSTWVEFAASYLFATSMYEMWIKDMVNKVLAIFKKWADTKLQ